MSLKTRVTTELNIQHPILLAPMTGVSGGTLAAAVSNAGGFGVIGGGYGDKEWLQRELLAAGNAPVAIGFISWALQKCPDLLNVALAREPKAIFLSFGEIRSFASQIKQAGIPLIAQIQTVAQARVAASEGAEFIVAQGTVTREGERRLRKLSKIHFEELRAIGPTLTRILKPFRRF